MNQIAARRTRSPHSGRRNALLNAAQSERAFALRAFTVISVLTAIAWILTG